VILDSELACRDLRHEHRGLKKTVKRNFERIQKLPKSRQRFVIEMLDTVLQQADR
jgi:hypothetical protein